jgi:hypothetical protein
LHVTLPHTDPPKSAKADVGLVVHGPGGWKFSIPMIALTSVITAFGVRMLPTPSTTDTKQDQIQVQMQTAELRAEQAREDTRRELSTVRDENRSIRTELSLVHEEMTALRRAFAEVRASAPQNH